MEQITWPDVINFLLALLAIGVAWFAGGRAGAEKTVAYQKSRARERRKSLITALLQDAIRAQRFFALNKKQVSSPFPAYIRFPIDSSQNLLLSGELDIEADKTLINMVGKYLDAAFEINSQIAMYELAVAANRDLGKASPRVQELHSSDLEQVLSSLEETAKATLG